MQFTSWSTNGFPTYKMITVSRSPSQVVFIVSVNIRNGIDAQALHLRRPRCWRAQLADV